MKEDKETVRHLPLSEAFYCILLALAEPLHGYGIMQKVEAGSEGAVRIGPGTLYGALTALEKEKLITLFRRGGAAQTLRPDRKRPRRPRRRAGPAAHADPFGRHGPGDRSSPAKTK